MLEILDKKHGSSTNITQQITSMIPLAWSRLSRWHNSRAYDEPVYGKCLHHVTSPRCILFGVFFGGYQVSSICDAQGVPYHTKVYWCNWSSAPVAFSSGQQKLNNNDEIKAPQWVDKKNRNRRTARYSPNKGIRYTIFLEVDRSVNPACPGNPYGTYCIVYVSIKHYKTYTQRGREGL